ncbi:hypothetical protein [Argonema galeatum]|uniref:hypothetical protein n=1 Tax=Argonema galeatum TaxID=2942762 RepID=UPI0020131AFB|nr:hypothetical protein [Argonema galeatum]MCL1467722.1 hypothetical protein [Argonema galeatum A003/A1]
MSTSSNGERGNEENNEYSSFVTTPGGRILTTHARGSLPRHGFPEPFDLVDDIIDNYSRRSVQSDGATVYIQRTGGKRRLYNVVIVGNEGIVTGFRQLERRELEKLGLNYGFNPNL